MKISKKRFLLIVIALVFLFLAYTLFELFSFAKGVNDDTKRNLLVAKEYIINTYFKGRIIEKKMCDRCREELKWGIIIQIDTINEPSFVERVNRSYSPYYDFINDSLLYMKVPQCIYNEVEEGSILIKKPASTHICVDNKESFQLLSGDSKKWLFSK